jgi:hypothetical protein
MLLTPEKIQQATKHAHERRPGVILSTMQIYEAIARAQHEEDVAWLDKYGRRLADTHFLLIIPIKDWQTFKEGGQ